MFDFGTDKSMRVTHKITPFATELSLKVFSVMPILHPMLVPCKALNAFLRIGKLGNNLANWVVIYTSWRTFRHQKQKNGGFTGAVVYLLTGKSLAAKY